MSKILSFKTLISKKVIKMLVWRSKFARFLLLNVYLPYRSALFSPILNKIVLTYFMTFLNNAIEFTESSAHSSLQKKEIASKCTTNQNHHTLVSAKHIVVIRSPGGGHWPARQRHYKYCFILSPVFCVLDHVS